MGGPMIGRKEGLTVSIQFVEGILLKYKPIPSYDAFRNSLVFLNLVSKNHNGSPVNITNKTVYDFTYRMKYQQNIVNRNLFPTLVGNPLSLRVGEEPGRGMGEGKVPFYQYLDFLRQVSGSEMFDLFQLYHKHSSNFTAMQSKLGRMVTKVVQKERDRQKVVDYTKMARDYKIVSRFARDIREIASHRSFHPYWTYRIRNIHPTSYETNESYFPRLGSVPMEHKMTTDGDCRGDGYPNRQDGEDKKHIRLQTEEHQSILKEHQNGLTNVRNQLTSQKGELKEIRLQQEKLFREREVKVNVKQAKEEFLKEFKESLWLEKMRRGLDS